MADALTAALADLCERLETEEKCTGWLGQRMTRLEEAQRNTAEDIREIKESVARLAEIASMGRGAWWLILRIGAALMGIAGLYGAIRLAGRQ